MIDPIATSNHIIETLTTCDAQYKLFEHRAALTYDDLAAAAQECGFHGTEGKCLVIKTDDRYIVYVTIQGQRVNFEAIKTRTNSKKAKLASAEELLEVFGAQPGCAYPFGFSKEIAIFIDPSIFHQEWFLFSPVLPTRTIQIKGADLQKIFSSLPNKVTEVTSFNLPIAQ